MRWDYLKTKEVGVARYMDCWSRSLDLNLLKILQIELDRDVKKFWSERTAWLHEMLLQFETTREKKNCKVLDAQDSRILYNCNKEERLWTDLLSALYYYVKWKIQCTKSYQEKYRRNRFDKIYVLLIRWPIPGINIKQQEMELVEEHVKLLCRNIFYITIR